MAPRDQHMLRRRIWIVYKGQRDPRKKPQERVASVEDPRRREDKRYLAWLISDGIPNTARNVQYFEKLADNIRQDIGTSEMQIQAVKAITQGVYVDIQTPLKLRKPMEKKLEETLSKIERSKKNLEGLKSLKEEQTKKLQMPCNHVRTNHLKIIPPTYMYRTRDEYNTKNRQHVCLIRDLFID